MSRIGAPGAGLECADAAPGRLACDSGVSLLLCFATPALTAQRAGAATSAAALLRQTRAYLESGNLERARTSAEAAAAQNPESSEAQYLLGLVRERQNDLTSAAAAYASAIQPGALTRRGRTIGSASCSGSRAGPPRRSAEFAEAVRLDPRLFDAQYHLGATRWWTRDLAGALPALTAAVALQPGHAEARYYLGITLEGLGRLEPAIAELRERGPPESRAGHRPHPARHGAPDARRSGRRDRAAPGSCPPRRQFCRRP